MIISIASGSIDDIKRTSRAVVEEIAVAIPAVLWPVVVENGSYGLRSLPTVEIELLLTHSQASAPVLADEVGSVASAYLIVGYALYEFQYKVRFAEVIYTPVKYNILPAFKVVDSHTRMTETLV